MNHMDVPLLSSTPLESVKNLCQTLVPCELSLKGRSICGQFFVEFYGKGKSSAAMI